MNSIAKLSSKDRKALFRNTAQKINMNGAIVEKDFWVCWTLDYLFHKCEWQNNFAFKGGTSLSKSHGLIKRFSEDIDLILDWRILDYGINEPWQERSNTKQCQCRDINKPRTPIDGGGSTGNCLPRWTVCGRTLAWLKSTTA